MNIIEMIIMTKSSKIGNYCIAGVDINTGEWIRVVSDDEEIRGALTDENITYEDGTQCEILDIVKVPYIENVGDRLQPENILLDREYYIEKEDEATLEDVLSLHQVEQHRYLFGTGYSSIKTDYLDERNVYDSLALIQVQNLIFNWKRNKKGKLKLRLTFDYNDRIYTDIPVTDPKFYGVKDGEEYEKAIVVMSLGVPQEGRCYKLAAQIFPNIKSR